MEKINAKKASLIYDILDESAFYRGTVQKDSRSLMNIPFRLPSEDLEKEFLSGATKLGLIGLKGHRSVGGIRASIYNAMPIEGVEKLTAYMREFEQKNS